MNDAMDFPKTFEEFAKEYQIVDTKEVYTNGVELIPVFRVQQWLDHLNDISNESEETKMEMTVERLTGEWLESNHAFGYFDFTCSKCNITIHDMPTSMGEPVFEFCPMCGARMLTKETEDDRLL